LPANFNNSNSRLQSIQDFLSLLHGVKTNGSNFVARCPAHDDNQQSLAVSEGTDGRVLINCFAGCTAADVVAAVGLELKDLFVGESARSKDERLPWDKPDKQLDSLKDKNPASPASPVSPPPTIASLAADKGLPAEFLAQFCEELPFGVKIVYRLSNNQPAPRQRLRIAHSAKEGSRWTKGDGSPIIYGSWRNKEMADPSNNPSNSILFVEGESDAWTAWHHSIAALGVPGADMAGKLQKQHVKDYGKVLIWKEPDDGGETFVKGVTERLAALSYEGEVFIVQGPADPEHSGGKPVKDLNQLHKNTLLPGYPLSSSTALFKEIWQGILAAAVPVDLGEIDIKVKNTKDVTPKDLAAHIYKDFTDEGNADRFIEAHGQDIRFCADWNRWLVWTGKRWENDRTGEIYRRGASISQFILRDAAAESDRDRQDALIDYAKKMRSRSRIKTMIETAQSRVPAIPEQFDQDKWLLNVQNGTLNLKTGELRPHDRLDYSLKSVPVTYVPDARAPASQAPTWQKFLARVTDDNPDLIAFLQRAAGYALTGDVSEHCLFFLHGDGRNGKSVFIEALKHALGDYAKTARPDILMAKRQGDAIPNEIAALAGVRFVATSESDSGKRFAEAMLKQATGGDTISARFLRAEFFEFEPQFKIFLASNHKPIIRGQDTAIWERIYLVPFTVYIPPAERDKNLGAKLQAEAAGILRWAVEGCLEWQRGGLQPPNVVKAATEGYKNEMDALGEFLADRCILQSNATATNSALWGAYNEWCRDNGEKFPLSRRDFKASLERRKIVQKRTGIRFWQGIGLLSETEGHQVRFEDVAGDVTRDEAGGESAAVAGFSGDIKEGIKGNIKQRNREPGEDEDEDFRLF
jgi:putative DNA primase/helicase